MDWLSTLKKDGICQINCPINENTLKKWNELLDPYFSQKNHEERSYATLEDLHQMGIFEEFFSTEMRAIINKVMPDPTLISFHASEIKGKNNKHSVFGEIFNGWHRDIADLPGLKPHDPNFVSLYIYLSYVKPGDGEFEIIQRSFTGPTMDGDHSLKMIGPKGTTFLWNRALLHRTAPNLSPGRRRVLKISFQHNYLQNDQIESESFKKIRSSVTDPFLKFLLGEKHVNSPSAHRAPFEGFHAPSNISLYTNARVKIALTEFIRGLWWFVRREKRPFGP